MVNPVLAFYECYLAWFISLPGPFRSYFNLCLGFAVAFALISLALRSK